MHRAWKKILPSVQTENMCLSSTGRRLQATGSCSQWGDSKQTYEWRLSCQSLISRRFKDGERELLSSKPEIRGEKQCRLEGQVPRKIPENISSQKRNQKKKKNLTANENVLWKNNKNQVQKKIVTERQKKVSDAKHLYKFVQQCWNLNHHFDVDEWVELPHF